MHIPQSKLPITIKVLLDIYQILDFTKIEDIVYWSAFLLGFYTLFRKSNLVAPSQTKFDKQKHLTRDKVTFSEAGLIVTVTWSKVIKDNKTSIKVPVFNAPGTPLSAPFWYKKMCKLVPAPSDSPAFVIPSGQTLKPVTYHKFVTKLKYLLDKPGYNSQAFSGHSFRHGGATFLAQQGFSVPEIMKLGDWSSDSVYKYIQTSYNDREQMAKRFALSVKERIL